MQKNDNLHNNNHNNNGNGSNDGAPGDEVLHIGERTFRKTKIGLAEEEVRAYVEELISQRNALSKRQEHLSGLTELAEKTIIEANNLSQLMMKKSAEQSKAEADKILVKAEQDSEQIIKTKKAEAKAAAEKEAAAIVDEAQRHAKSIREEQFNSIRTEAASLAQKLQNELIVNIENIKKQVLSIGIKIEPVASANHVSPPTARVDNKERGENKDKTLSEGEKGVLREHIPWLEIEIMPPMDIEKIMEFIAHLESLPQVKTTDLLPETPNPLIRVFLNEPSPLAEVLQTFPEVAQVSELADATGSDTPSGEQRQRIQIVLGKNPGKNADAKKNTIIKTTS
jgi:F0F1-type ATP synthase membrane subunit b/b'